LRMNLTIVIPVTTLIAKIFIQIFSRDSFEEVSKSLANFPLELMLIAMSFMLSALSGLSAAYTNGFENQGDADLFAVVTMIVIFALSLIINRMTRWLYVLSTKLQVAYAQYSKLSSQPAIPNTVPDVAIMGRVVWAMFYCSMMTLVLVCTFGVSVLTLSFVLHLIE